MSYCKLLPVILLSCLLITANAQVIPVALKCELRENPQGIDVPEPGLSYILKANKDKTKNITQRAYQVLVSRSAGFKAGEGLWDSKKTTGSQMAYIIYKGRPLRSNEKCWWKVRVWDQHGRVSPWSRAAVWTMGVLKPADWQAKWISAAGADKYALPAVGYKSKSTNAESAVKWVQVDLGRPQAFNEVRLFPSFFADRAGYAFPVRFKVECADEPTFKTPVIIGDYTGKDVNNPHYPPVHVYNKANVTGRYIRLTVTRSPEINSGYTFSLRQIGVISSGKNIAAGKPVEALDSDESNGFTKNNLTDRVEDDQTFPNYSSMMLRREFAVKPALIRAVINISGLSEYELTINGKKIGNYLLTPGWTDYRKTVLYDTYEVTKQLKSGNNAIGIILGNSVYNIQPDTQRYVKFLTTFGAAKAKAQLRLEYADGSVKLISTDKSWQVAPGPITYSNLYGGEDYNADIAASGWNKPGFAASDKWAAAMETDGPGGVLKGLSCAAPPVTAIDSIRPVKVTKVKENLWIYDFGQNASMMPALIVKGLKGSFVRMIPSELLGKDGLADRRSATQDGVRPAWWQYTLSGNGSEKYFPKFFYQGARYLQVELYPAPAHPRLPEVEQLTDVIVHSSSTPVGKFECSNQLFNKIYSLVRWAQRSNMMSLMTDCPQREKMGWLEENHLNGPALRYNFDMAPLFRKTMNDMADAQLDNGLIPNIAPEYFIAGSPDLGNAMRNSPEWGSSFIIVPWQQYLFSGDISLLERYYDRMKRFVGFLGEEAKGHIIYTGLGDWYDIGPKEPWGSQLTPVSFTGTAIYYYDTEIMSHIAQRLGKTADAVAFKKEAEQTRAAFNKLFYHPETGLYATGSQTTSAMPLFFNLVEPQGRGRLLDSLTNDIRRRNNSFTSGEVGYRFLLRALADGGRSDVVYNMNNQSARPGYGYQIKMGATSLTEKWDAGVGNFGSQNHFMSGQINEWFFNDLIGISPDESGPGFRKFIVKPAFLKGLDWVKGSYASISGDIECAWKRGNGEISLNVTVPPNTSATICLPPSTRAKSTTTGPVTYQIGSGTYHFTIKE